MPAIQLQANNMTWQVDNKIIVDDVSLSVYRGETLGIIGPNGAGKTSLLKCLYSENQLSSGDVMLDGVAIKTISRRQLAQKVAVVSQHNDLVFELSVFDIVHMGLLPHKGFFEKDNTSDRELICKALNKVDLLLKKDQSFSTLSGGEQQRCLIARAIVQRPQLLIMDEPTNHLDVYYQHQILALVNSLGLTLVITIHDLNLAAQYCDRLLLLANGKVQSVDTPEQVLVPKQLQQVFKLECLVDKNPLINKPRVTFAGATSGQ